MRATEVREFPTEVIASISSGKLLCDFSKMHEAAEYLMGHPIWSHQFAHKELCAEMRAAITEQCPGMPTALPHVNGDNWRDAVADLVRELGPVQRIRQGSGLTALLPTDGLPPHVEVITVKPRSRGEGE